MTSRENTRLLSQIGARYVTYDQLVLEAQRSYSDYIERQKTVSELAALVDRLDEDFS